jgi:hypothetical protein
MEEFWRGFLWGAGAVSVGEVALAVAIGLYFRRQERKALDRLEARLYRYAGGSGTPGE